MRKTVRGFQAVQPQKMARGLKFRIEEVEGMYYLSLFSHLRKKMFSHDTAQMVNSRMYVCKSTQAAMHGWQIDN